MRQPATASRRKRGTPSRKTKQRIEAIKASSLTPLDHMLAVMRNPKAKAARRDEMARMAAPYVHPPIAPLDIDVMRLVARLLNEIAKSDADPAKRQT
jgi:hypothetical protein